VLIRELSKETNMLLEGNKIIEQDLNDLKNKLVAIKQEVDLVNKDIEKQASLLNLNIGDYSKLELEKEMKRVFIDVFDDEYLETKFATTYKLDAINREVEILRKKLNNK
jgi:hypothetical protein